MSLRVTVVGGGFAAAEALLALRARGGEELALELLAPFRELPFRPAATASDGPVPVFDLGELCEDVGARLRVESVQAVAPAVRRLRLGSGGTAAYDALVLAVGARARVAVPGATTFRRLPASWDGVRRLAVAVPAGVTWSLPAYEVALAAADAGVEATVVTPERAPLEVFGEEGVAAVREVLHEHGVRVLRSARPALAERGALRLADGDRVPADEVIALPALAGHRLPGVPAGFGGFVPTDAHGRVEDVPGVWAAGDVTGFPVKQGGIAAQQADRAARAIARLARDGALPPLEPLVLRARLHAAGEPLFLRTELTEHGDPVPGTGEASGEPLWWPPAKLAASHLTPWLAAHAPAAAHA